MKLKELNKHDIIYFNKKTGKGSVVKIDSKNWFMPAKKHMRLSGKKTSIIQNEPFVFVDYDILLKEKNHRQIKFTLNRISNGDIFYISENELMEYFALWK